jgi:hypothetical protein
MDQDEQAYIVALLREQLRESRGGDCEFDFERSAVSLSVT